MKRPSQHTICLFTFTFCLVAAVALAGCQISGHTVPAKQEGGKAPDATTQKTQPTLLTQYGQLPLSFEANLGQTDPRVQFLARGRGYTLFLTQDEAVFVLRKAKTEAETQVQNSSPVTRHSSREYMQTVLRMHLEGANQTSEAVGGEKLPGIANYFIGNDPQKWHTNIPTYKKVEYKDVYPGIDLAYYGSEGKLEYDLIVAPGADPTQIKLAFDGTEKIEVDPATGDLVLTLANSEQRIANSPEPVSSQSELQATSYPLPATLRLQKPLVYQLNDKGHKALVAGNYVLLSEQPFGRLRAARRVASSEQPSSESELPATRYQLPAIGIQLASYDRSKRLIIDPVLVYSTYLGGSDAGDRALGIAVDTAGNAYVIGQTGSTDFPTTPGAFDTSLSFPFVDAFVTKINPTGSGLVYSTYLGGSSGESQSFAGIAVDAAGNAHVTGSTESTDFPTTPGAFQTTFGGIQDVFVTKLNPTGSSLLYSTYLGGSGFEEGVGVAVDTAGNAYLMGSTQSPGFPTTVGAFQPAFGGAPNDAFVAKLNPLGTGLIYSTFLGGSEGDIGHTIAIDAGGNAYVTGDTQSTDFPTTPGAFQTVFAGGGTDAFVTKLNPTGSALDYSTYLGGDSFEDGSGVAVDTAGNAYVTGFTDSTNFPTTFGAFQTTPPGGSSDVFVAKLNPTGSGLVYSTYLGGSGEDGFEQVGIAVDTAGNAYVTGITRSPDFPTTPGAFQTSLGGGTCGFDPCSDAFVTKLNPTASGLVYSSYLGGSGDDVGRSIALDAMPNPNAYVTGITRSPDFPTTTGAFQPAALSNSTAFVAKIGPFNTLVGANVNVSAGNGVTVTFTAVVAPGDTGATTSSTGPTPPAGFTLGTPPTYYDVTTTATYVPPVSVCITYDPAQFSDPDSLRLFHFENDAWVDVTTSHDTNNDVICGQVSSLSLFVIAQPSGGPLTSLGPANIWVGLKNSDAVGIRFDLKAEVYRNSTQLVGSGEIASVPGGSSGFNNANQDTIPMTPVEGTTFQSGDTVSIKLYVRNACTGSSKNSGTARLWFNDSAANSRFDATIGGDPRTYFLRDAFVLATTPGPGPKKTIDVAAGAKCSLYKTFGTWTTTIP